MIGDEAVEQDSVKRERKLRTANAILREQRGNRPREVKGQVSARASPVAYHLIDDRTNG